MGIWGKVNCSPKVKINAERYEGNVHPQEVSSRLKNSNQIHNPQPLLYPFRTTWQILFEVFPQTTVNGAKPAGHSLMFWIIQDRSVFPVKHKVMCYTSYNFAATVSEKTGKQCPPVKMMGGDKPMLRLQQALMGMSPRSSPGR